jgi:hypothetical protein
MSLSDTHKDSNHISQEIVRQVAGNDMYPLGSNKVLMLQLLEGKVNPDAVRCDGEGNNCTRLPVVET